jgi:hypothetical protein
MLAAAYATAWMLEVPVSAVWSALVLALVAVIPCAAYVSVINDLTDRHDDATAGKANRLTDQPRAVVALLLIGTIAPAVVLLWYWWSDPLLRWTYACVWIAFSLYSIPPARLKHRGFAGVLADASGAHLFPTLLFVLLIVRGAERPVDPIWLGAVGIWALCDGLRGILWHQLGDRRARDSRRVSAGTRRARSCAVAWEEPSWSRGARALPRARRAPMAAETDAARGGVAADRIVPHRDVRVLRVLSARWAPGGLCAAASGRRDRACRSSRVVSGTDAGPVA